MGRQDPHITGGPGTRVLGQRTESWAVWVLDGSEPRYYLSNAPEDTALETLAYVGGSRWRIETEFQREKSDVGLDDNETPSIPGGA